MRSTAMALTSAHANISKDEVCLLYPSASPDRFLCTCHAGSDGNCIVIVVQNRLVAG
jgi:hypothetical protein